MQLLPKRASAGSRRILALSFGMLALSSTCRTGAGPLDPNLSTEANLVRLEASILANSQFSHHPLDQELAARFLNTYVDALDAEHALFLQSDLDAFARSAPKLSSAIRAGETQLAFEIRARYLERLGQRTQYARTLLAGPPFQFSTDATFRLDRTDAPRPKDLAAARALWERQLRAEYLEEKLEGTAPDQIASTLERRYEQRLLSARMLRDRDVLAIYLDALATVYDPHSQYLSGEQLRSLDSGMNLSLSGIGARLEKFEGHSRVVDVVPGGPAAQSALAPGDRIVSVAQADGPPVDVRNLPLSRVVGLIRGPKGTRVTLQVLPAGGSGTGAIEISLVRAKVQLADQRAHARVVDVPAETGTARTMSSCKKL